MERDKDQLRTAEKKAKDVADERHRTIQYAEGEKLGLTRILHDQEETVKTLNKDLEEVMYTEKDHEKDLRKVDYRYFWRDTVFPYN